MVSIRKREKKPAPEPAQPQEWNAVAVSRWGDWKTWLNIAFLFLTLWTAVYSIEYAKWIAPQPPFTLVLILSIAFIWVLNALKLPGWVMHFPAVIIGVLVTLWQGTAILPAGGGISRLFTVLNAWMQGGAGLQEAEAKAIFGTALVLLTWVVGYISAWFMLRRRNAWVGVGLGLIIVIVNLTNLTNKSYVFFTLFLMSSVLLIVWNRAAVQGSSSKQSAGFSGKGMAYLMGTLLCITAVAVSISWFFPQLRVPALQDSLAAAMPWKQNLQNSDFNILNQVPSKLAVSTAALIQELDFGEAWHESDEIKYIVKSPQPSYWQVNVYDTYDSNKWTTSLSTQELLEKKTGWVETDTSADKTRLIYEVKTGMNTDVVLLTGDFSSSEMPVIASLGASGDVIAVKAPRVLNAGESYKVRTYMADSSPDSLNATGTAYPEEIKNIYLQLPASLPEQVRALSENITQNAATPYDKAAAIDAFLAKIPYSKTVEKLPEGADAVSDFLFTQKKGFCVHFASAMTVLLRASGVPARMVVGYLPGEHGEKNGEYILRDKNYHAWAQVYFPGSGWIDFEATPSGEASRVYVDTPVISERGIQEMPDWYMQYFLGSGTQGGREIEDNAQAARRNPGGAFSFSDELGRITLVILCAMAAFAAAWGISRIVRPINANRIWHVDRGNLASSVYESLCRLAVMSKLSPEAQQTPLEFASQIAQIIPDQSEELACLVNAYLESRFGPVKGKPELYREAEILKARVKVYNAILRHKGKWHKFLWTS